MQQSLNFGSQLLNDVSFSRDFLCRFRGISKCGASGSRDLEMLEMGISRPHPRFGGFPGGSDSKESAFNAGSSVQSLSHIQLFEIPWIAARQASLSITNSQSSLKLVSIELVMPSNHLILCRPLLLLPSIFPNIRIFSSESTLHIRWPKYWSFSFSTRKTKFSQQIFKKLSLWTLLGPPAVSYHPPPGSASFATLTVPPWWLKFKPVPSLFPVSSFPGCFAILIPSLWIQTQSSRPIQSISSLAFPLLSVHKWYLSS